MSSSPPTKNEGMQIARKFKSILEQKGYPVLEVLLFGSVANGKPHRWSDIDIAVLCDPFLASKHEENVRFLLDSKEIDIRIQTICLHPKDLHNKYYRIGRDIRTLGISV